MFVFIALCLCVCMVLSVGMLFRPTTEPIGNEKRATLPSLFTEDVAFNTDYMT